MLNCDHQWYPSDQNESRSTDSRNGEPNNNPRRIINNITQMLTPHGSKMTQPNIRGRWHHGENSSHGTPQITFNCHQSTQFTNHTYQMTLNSWNAHCTLTFRTINTSGDHQGFHDRRSFWLDGSFNDNFPHENHNIY